MDFDLEGAIYEYTLNVVSIKMEVNFPCKMKIEHNSSTLTTEVPSNGSHRFNFNQEISIRESLHKNHFELQICLLTDKGAKYTAGVIKLFHNELQRSEGERMVIALTRCLDKEAFCEIIVDKVNKSVVNKRPTFGKQMRTVQTPMFDTHDIENIEPQQNRFKPKQNYNIAAETKSEFQFPINNGRNKTNIEWDQKSREVPQSYYQRNPSKSPNTRTNANRSRAPKSIVGQQRERHDIHEDIETYSRDKLIEAEVYKEEYVKLKEKYRKEAETAKNELNKRIELQNSENTLKLEVMKYKLKADELERASNDKAIKIKDLQSQLNVLQQRELEIQYLKNDIQQKDNQMRMIEDTLRQLSHENDELKAINQNQYNQEVEKIKELKHELENNKNKYELRIHELEKDLKLSEVETTNMEKEIIKLNTILDQEKNTIIQLENTLNDKTYEFEKIIQSEKSSCQNSLDEMYNKLEKIEKELIEKEQSYRELYKENEKLKTAVMKLEYDKKILLQDNESLKSEYHDVKIYKEKYNLLFREHKFLLEEKKQLEKQLDKTIATKDINIQEMNLQYNDQIEYYKKMNRETDERAKNYSNKIIELEGQIDIVKSQAEKVRRNNENLIKDLAEAKEKEKQAKKALKTKEQEILSLEAEYSTIRQKSKNIDQIFKLETDKLKDEIEKLKSELEHEFIKNAQLSESNNEIGMELSKLRVKLQFTEERLEKDSTSLKDRQIQLENLIKDYEAQISSLEDTINYLRQNEKELSSNLSRTEIEALKSEELSEKRQKQIKSLEEKLFNSENVVRVKEQEISNLQFDREELLKKINDLENDINDLKSEGSALNNEKNIGLKAIQIYEDDLKKAKHDIQVFTLSLAEKERDFETQKNELKTVKEELMRSELRYSALKKETDRFRESLTESLNNSFIPILGNLNIFGHSTGEETSINTRNYSWLTGVDIERNKKIITETTSWTEIVSTIISQSKDLKLLLNRLFEQIKTLQKEVERMTEEQNMSTSKHQSSEFQLQRTINELENELSSLLTIKEEETIKYDHMVQELNNTLKEKENEINDLHQELEELHFTLNSINVDFQQTNEGHTKKLTDLKKQKNEVEKQYEDICEQHMNLEDNFERLKSELEQIRSQLQNSRISEQNLTQEISRLNDVVSSQESQLEELKRNKKSLLERISEIELQLSTEIDMKGKTQLLLMDEEKKNQELKEFTNNLMKQKENAIKSDLLKTEQIINLETTNIELERDREILIEENERVKKSLDEVREQIKTLTLKIKVLEDEIVDELNEKLKLNDKIKEKDREIQQHLEQIKKIESKHQKLTERFSNEKLTLEEELEEKNEQLKQKIQSYSENIISLEKTIHEKSSKILSLENNINEFEEELWSKKDFIEKLQQEVQNYEHLIEQEKAHTEEKDIANQELLSEIKEKEENMFELSGKLYNLELRLSSTEADFKNKLEELDLEWADKYESQENEYQQRLELIEKERDYFKNLIEEKEHEINAIRSESKNHTLEESSMKKTLEEKIKKLEEDRLQLFTLKTQEIQKLTDEIKRLTDTIRTKESENRRLANEIEIARASITKMDEKSKDFEEKFKNINKLYTSELEQLKKKEQAYKAYKEWIINQQWAIEREIKKVMSAFIKRFLENIVVDEKNSSKMVEIVKNFENTVIEAVSNKLEEQ